MSSMVGESALGGLEEGLWWALGGLEEGPWWALGGLLGGGRGEGKLICRLREGLCCNWRRAESLAAFLKPLCSDWGLVWRGDRIGALGGGTVGGGGPILFGAPVVGVIGTGDWDPDPTMVWELGEGDMGGEREGAGEGELKGDTEFTDSEEGLLRGV